MIGRIVLLSAAIAVGAAGCGVGAENQARPAGLPEPVPLSTPTDGADGERRDAVAATIYLADHDGVLHPVSRGVPASNDPATHLRVVLDRLLDGPTADELERGLRSAVPAGVRVNEVTVADGVVAVDLSRAFESVGGRQELLASAQLVLAVTAVPGADRARLFLDGEPSRLPLPDGSLEAEPVSREDYLELLAS